MKKLLVLLCCLPVHPGFAQSGIQRYVRLHMQYYRENGERYLGVSPELVTTGNDTLARAMTKYPRRFRYILMNKTRFQGIYEKYYPDTTKINRLFTDSLSMDGSFMRAFDLLSAPFTGVKLPVARFSREQLIQVAARFFYCQSVRPDSSIASAICIGRNGLERLNVSPDQAVLEAFCFEAIFEKYYTAPGIKHLFVAHFLSSVEEGSRHYRYLFKDKERYLQSVREYCFKKIEQSSELANALLDYYQANRNSFAFVIG